MTAASIALLEDRGVIAVTGEDAGKFLDNLITNDMGLIEHDGAIFAALLSPQGKILFDFFVVVAAEGYFLDVAKDQVARLIQRLTLYKLRAKIAIAEVRNVNVYVDWSAPARPRGFRDPRSTELGQRMLSSGGVEHTGDQNDYHAHRISLGVPEGGKDYEFGDAFPHEALIDRLNGVSFTKGCYVGQEIVARMEHRGTARRRIVRVSGERELPAMGTDVLAGEVTIGTMGSHAGDIGLAMLRLDRVAEFAAKGIALTAGGVSITPDRGDVARLMPRVAE